VGIATGGLVFAAPLAARLRVPLVPLRKVGTAAASDAAGTSLLATKTPPPVLLSPPYGGSFIGHAVTAAAGGEQQAGHAQQAVGQQELSCKQQQQQLEMWAPSLQRGQRVVIVDDLLASGATLAAAVQLMRDAGVCVAAVAVAVELPAHGGRQVLTRACEAAVCVESLLVFEGL
jgi:adenine/guanine phosphoribosyltransferase-like PRPP-binding protein